MDFLLYKAPPDVMMKLANWCGGWGLGNPYTSVFTYVYLCLHISYIYMVVDLKVLVLSVVCDDLLYAKMTFGES